MSDLVKRLQEHDDERLYEEADFLLCEAANEIVRLRAEVERLRRFADKVFSVMSSASSDLAEIDEAMAELEAAAPAPSQSADAEDAAIRGAHIKGNMFHDAGAYAQCGHCGRYSDDPRSLKLDIFLCECGMSHGWTGSFKRPTKESKWSDAAIDAARGGES